MSTEAREPGQRAYEAYAEALRSKSFFITPWEKLEGCSRYGFAAVEQVCAVPAPSAPAVEAWAVECLDAWAITHESPVPQVTRHSDGSGWTCTPVDMMAASIDDYEGATPSMARIAAAQALYAADPSLPPPPKESR